MILIGVGGNLDSPQYGSPRAVLAAALATLPQAGVRVVARSSWYRSEPVPRSEQPWFVNAVAEVESDRPAESLLDVLLNVEARFGRRRSVPNAARIIDLDLLDHDGQRVDCPSLTLPHPRLHQRRFVLAPLAEVAPDWRHPILGQTAEALLAGLPPGQPLFRSDD